MPNFTGEQAVLRDLLWGKNNGTVSLCYGFSQLCFKWLCIDDRTDTRRGVRGDRFLGALQLRRIENEKQSISLGTAFLSFHIRSIVIKNQSHGDIPSGRNTRQDCAVNKLGVFH